MVAVSIALLSELFWIPIYPFWSMLIIVLYMHVITGLVMAKSSE